MTLMTHWQIVILKFSYGYVYYDIHPLEYS